MMLDLWLRAVRKRLWRERRLKKSILGGNVAAGFWT